MRMTVPTPSGKVIIEHPSELQDFPARGGVVQLYVPLPSVYKLDDEVITVERALELLTPVLGTDRARQIL